MILILIAATTLGALGLAACGEEESSTPRVVATTGVVASIVEEVAGEDAEVVQLIPDSASPHDFSLSAQDRLELEDADLIVYNGAELEAGVPVAEAESPKWSLVENAEDLLPDDPHVWMDPLRTAAALPSLAEALGTADPEHAIVYRDRAAALGERLEDLDREIARSLDSLPTGERELVTSHDALGYFADRYDLEVIATAFPTSGAEAEPSAAALADVQQAIRQSGVPAVFAEEGDDPQVLEQVASEADVEVIDELLVESPGAAGTYEAMLRHDAELITDALAG
jgi:zinc/manganese transport system substrate-binding protein